MVLNGGPEFTFSEAISFSVSCDGQEEVDRYWYTLSEGGEEGPCGWLKDKFGVSWQIVPTALPELLADPDPQKAQRVMDAMMAMKKLDVADLQRAYDAARPLRRVYLREPHEDDPRNGASVARESGVGESDLVPALLLGEIHGVVGSSEEAFTVVVWWRTDRDSDARGDSDAGVVGVFERDRIRERETGALGNACGLGWVRQLLKDDDKLITADTRTASSPRSTDSRRRATARRTSSPTR